MSDATTASRPAAPCAAGLAGLLPFLRPYRGRIALFELLVANPAIRALIRNGASAGEFLRVAIGDGMHTLKQDGIEKILMGKTDLLQVGSACV